MAGKEYIEANVHIKADGCWVWQGGAYPSGYGYCRVAFNKSTLAHKVSYEAFRGPIPEGRKLRRLCDLKRCCNPEHFELIELRTKRIASDTELREYAIKMWELKTGHDRDVATAVGVSVGPDATRPGLLSCAESVSQGPDFNKGENERGLSWNEVFERLFLGKGPR